MPREFPRGDAADLFPLNVHAPAAGMPRTLQAVTVFTAYEVDQRTRDQPFAEALHLAICACGDPWKADSQALLRKALGAHSCSASRERPIELVPIDDHPTDETLQAVLRKLRSM
jgi:hypothetical protein